MKVYRIEKTRFLFFATPDEVVFHQVGPAPKDQEIDLVIKAGLQLWLQEGNPVPDAVKIECRTGMSGCRDWYVLHQFPAIHIPGFGYVEGGSKKNDFLHISMYGRLNAGLLVGKNTAAGLKAYNADKPVGAITFIEMPQAGTFIEIGCETILVAPDRKSVSWKGAQYFVGGYCNIPMALERAEDINIALRPFGLGIQQKAEGPCDEGTFMLTEQLERIEE